MIGMIIIIALVVFFLGASFGSWVKQREVRSYVERERKSALSHKRDFEDSDSRSSWWAGVENALDLLAYNVLGKPDVT